MKNIVTLIFLIYPVVGFSCNYSDMLSHLDGIKDLTNLSPLNCTDSDEYFDKEEVCECVLENKKFNPKTANLDKKRKIPLIKKALDKAEIGLYNISKKVLSMAVMAGSGPRFEPDPSCNLTNELMGESLSCPNISGEPILSIDQRKAFARNLINKYEQELKASYLNNSSKLGLVDRTTPETQNSCSLPEKEVMKINQNLIPTQIAYITELVRSNPSVTKGANNLNEALSIIADSADKSVVRSLNSIQGSNNNPVLNNLLASPGFLQEILISEKSGIEIYQESYQSGALQKNLNENLNQSCKKAFANIKEALCLTTEKNLIPSDSDRVIDIFSEMEKRTNTSKVEAQLLTSSILDQEYCLKGESDLDKFEAKVNADLPLRLQSVDGLKNLYIDEFTQNIKAPSEEICSHLPPTKSVAALEAEAEACRKESEKKNELYNSKCLLLETVLSSVKPKYDAKVKNIEKLALTQAKDEAIAAGKEANDPSVMEKAKEIANSMKDNIDTEAIFDALNDKKELDGLGSDAGARLLADFIGTQTETTASLATNSEIASSRTVDSDHDGLSPSEGSNRMNASLAAAAFNDADNPSAQSSIKRFNDMSPEDRQTEESMNKVYDEISRRITRTRPARKAARVAAGVLPNQVYVPEDIVEAMDSPYPQNDYENQDLYASNKGGTYDPVINNFYDAPSIEAKPLEALSPAESSSQARKEQARGYNKALAGMQASRQVMARRNPASTISSPKVKVSGVGPNNLASEIPEMALPTSNIDGALNELVDNAIAETGISGSDEANTDQAENLLELLNPEKNGSFILKDDTNDNLKVRIAKVNGKFIIKEFYGSETDPGYKRFKRKIERSILLKDNFKGLIKKLNSALSVNSNLSTAKSSPNYQDINQNFN